METVTKILDGFKQSFHQYASAKTETLKFQQEVADMCKMNYCGMYGKTWMCPPAVGTYREMEEKLRVYPYFFVFTTKHDIEDSFDFEGMGRGKEEHKRVQDAVQEALRGTDSRMLGAGGCSICKACAYPDAPCRFPELAIPSIEACGINVVELSQDLGINYMNGQNTVTYFSMVLYK